MAIPTNEQRMSADNLWARRYTTILRMDEDGDWVSAIHEFPGCTAHGATQAEALAHLQEIREGWVAICEEQALPIPAPSHFDSPADEIRAIEAERHAARAERDEAQSVAAAAYRVAKELATEAELAYSTIRCIFNHRPMFSDVDKEFLAVCELDETEQRLFKLLARPEVAALLTEEPAKP